MQYNRGHRRSSSSSHGVSEANDSRLRQQRSDAASLSDESQRISRPISSERESSLGTGDEDGLNDHRVVARGADRYFARNESINIKELLRRKLLSSEGKALVSLERALHKADRKDRGVLERRQFVDTLLSGVAGKRSPDKDQAKWLSEQLRTRNGTVEYPGIRHVLGIPEPGVEAPSKDRSFGRLTLREQNSETDDTSSASDRSGSRRKKRAQQKLHPCSGDHSGRGAGGIAPLPGGGRDAGSGAGRTIATLQREKWAVRHGSVGKWLAEVATPLELKLFSDFAGTLEEFERRNGLDHLRVGRPEDHQDGTTVVHLGPTLKCALRFFV